MNKLYTYKTRNNEVEIYLHGENTLRLWRRGSAFTKSHAVRAVFSNALHEYNLSADKKITDVHFCRTWNNDLSIDDNGISTHSIDVDVSWGN